MKVEFMKQFSVEEDKNTTWLGMGFIEYKSILDFDLQYPPSLINDTIKAERLMLANI